LHMPKVINFPRLASSYPSEHSTGSATHKKSQRASVVPLRSQRPKTLGGYAPAETTSQPVDEADLGLAPWRPDRPKWKKSGLCPEALAFPELIMDYKSMQPWITEQLTPAVEARRIAYVSAGRPKEPIGPAAYRAAFIKRIRAARALYTDSPPEMAKALGVERDTYYRYEKRLMMPHHLIPRFCEITGVTIQWLLEGPDRAKAMAPHLPATGTDSR
jgi:hypothetical protein